MKPTVTVCGLGPGGHDRIANATLSTIEGADRRFLRTRRHPSASLVPNATTFDHLYDGADSFAEVYAGIAETVAEAALERPEESVVYIVPGSPLILENSVRRLQADTSIDVEIVPALSFLDEAWARLAIDPIEASVRLVDGHQFATQAAGERGPLLVAHVHDRWVLSDIKLAVDADDDQRAVVLQRLGTPEEQVFEVAWSDLDRLVEPDHLTSLFLPEVVAPVGQELVASVELMQRLRRDCPWDRDQDHGSLRPFLVEETYEVLDALDGVVLADPDDTGALGEAYADLEEELGDLWFQILFHAELATEAGQFTIAEVAAGLREKMVRRHPHVFAGVDVDGAEDLVSNWQRIKQDEKPRRSALDGIPTGLPALSYAAKLLARAERSGAPPPAPPASSDAGPLDEAALGRRLLGLVVEARAAGLDPETALRHAIRAVVVRFQAAEEAGEELPPHWVLG